MAAPGIWLDLMERLTRLGELADRPLEPGVRRVALLQVAREAEEVATLAALLAESAEGWLAPDEARAELDRLARDLEALTGAGLLLDVAAGGDGDVMPVLLRLVSRHGGAAARRARLVLGGSGDLSGECRPERTSVRGQGDPGVIGGVPE